MTAQADEMLDELARVDGQAARWWLTASNLHDALEAAFALLGRAELVENDSGDNESAVVPIDVWRTATGIMRDAIRSGFAEDPE